MLVFGLHAATCAELALGRIEMGLDSFGTGCDTRESVIPY